MIGILNYGLGNIGSIENMLNHLYIDHFVVDSPRDANTCDKYILPGVGAFDAGMTGLTDSGLAGFIMDEVVTKRKQILGICLGMQLLCQRSEEGDLDGLGLIDAKVKKLTASGQEKIPNIGWHDVSVNGKNNLFSGLDHSRFYFVHSYGVKCKNKDDIVSNSLSHGGYTQIFSSKNVHGVQFHPEKSHKFGMKLFSNYARLKIS